MSVFNDRECQFSVIAHTYLRTKYRDLPSGEIERIQAFAAEIAEKHGINLSGPAPGEDEHQDNKP